MGQSPPQSGEGGGGGARKRSQICKWVREPGEWRVDWRDKHKVERKCGVRKRGNHPAALGALSWFTQPLPAVSTLHLALGVRSLSKLRLVLDEVKIQTHSHLGILVLFHTATSCPLQMIWIRVFFLQNWHVVWRVRHGFGNRGCQGVGWETDWWPEVGPRKITAPIIQEGSSQHPLGFWGSHYCLMGLQIIFRLQIRASWDGPLSSPNHPGGCECCPTSGTQPFPRKCSDQQ